MRSRLPGVAADGAGLGLGVQARSVEPGPGLGDFLSRADLHAQVVDGAAGARCRVSSAPA
jgi:hypothetical protein